MKNNRKIWVAVTVQWGSGSESYDFCEVMRWVDTVTGKIYKPFILLRGFINLFRLHDGVCDYGWGYSARDEMFSDMAKGYINLDKLKLKN